MRKVMDDYKKTTENYIQQIKTRISDIKKRTNDIYLIMVKYKAELLNERPNILTKECNYISVGLFFAECEFWNRPIPSSSIPNDNGFDLVIFIEYIDKLGDSPSIDQLNVILEDIKLIENYYNDVYLDSLKIIKNSNLGSKNDILKKIENSTGKFTSLILKYLE